MTTLREKDKAEHKSSYNTVSKNGEQLYNNLQPYITVYFWKRTA
jgi:hypothetical protein